MLQQQAIAEHKAQMEAFKTELLHYEKQLNEWKRKKKDGYDPPVRPIMPVLNRYYCDDVTVEALADQLKRQPRGLLLIRDELAGWIAAFNQYKGGKGSDGARFLEMFGGRAMMVDRKTDDVTFVSRAAVSITGGIQPGILQRYMTQEYRDNGLLARLLLAMPPRLAKSWTETDISDAYLETLGDIFGNLYRLEPEVETEDEYKPLVLGINQTAKTIWVSFYDDNAKEMAGLTGDLAAAYSKLESYVARIALVIHCVREASGEKVGKAIDETSMKSAVTLVRWFAGEARRVYGMMAESAEAAENRRLLELIKDNGGSLTPRELMRADARTYRTSEDAKAALEELGSV